MLTDTEREIYNRVVERYHRIGIDEIAKIIVEMEKEMNHYRQINNELREKIVDLQYAAAEAADIDETETVVAVMSKRKIGFISINFEDEEHE